MAIRNTRMDLRDLAPIVRNKQSGNMGKIKIIVLFMLFSNATFCQSEKAGTVEGEILKLIDRLQERHGNIYLIDNYESFKLNETSKEYNPILGIAYDFVRQNSISWYATNYVMVINQFQPTKIVSKEVFLRQVNNELVLSKEEKMYAEKLDYVTQKHTEAILVDPPQSDSINNLFKLVDQSVITKAIYDKARKTEKKLFSLDFTYASNLFILIGYSINFGHRESYNYVELILR